MPTVRKFDRIQLPLPETPDAFVRTAKKPEEMSYWQLKRFARKVQNEGYDAAEYQVDVNVKLAFPFITLVMVLLGIPIALVFDKGGTPVAVALGIAACFLYALSFGFGRSLGLAGVFPPLFAAWVANILFFFLASYLMTRVRT
jgi:lipopolysaccharide export system permease protein